MNNKEHACKNTRSERALSILVTRLVILNRSFRQAGEVFGISADRARRIVVRTMRQATALDLYPDGRDTIQTELHDIRAARLNKSFWLARINDIMEFWGITQNNLIVELSNHVKYRAYDINDENSTLYFEITGKIEYERLT